MSDGDSCNICGKKGVKLYRNVGKQKDGSKMVWWICTACATTRQLRRHYLKKSICELEEMRVKAEKRLSTLVSILGQKLIKAKQSRSAASIDGADAQTTKPSESEKGE